MKMPFWFVVLVSMVVAAPAVAQVLDVPAVPDVVEEAAPPTVPMIAALPDVPAPEVVEEVLAQQDAAAPAKAAVPAVSAGLAGDPGLPSPQDLANALASPFGLALAGWVIAYFLMELCKAIVPAFDTATPNLKRMMAILFGALGGLGLCLGGASPLAWWCGLVYGALGAAGVAATRGLALLKRYGPAEDSTRGCARPGMLAMLVVLGASLVLLGVVACRPITPAVQAGASQIGKGYVGYVHADPVLTATQRAERVEMVCNHLKLTGTDLLPVCVPEGVTP